MCFCVLCDFRKYATSPTNVLTKWRNIQKIGIAIDTEMSAHVSLNWAVSPVNLLSIVDCCELRGIYIWLLCPFAVFNLVDHVPFYNNAWLNTVFFFLFILQCFSWSQSSQTRKHRKWLHQCQFSDDGGSPKKLHFNSGMLRQFSPLNCRSSQWPQDYTYFCFKEHFCSQGN